MLINNIRKSPTFPIRNTIHAPTRGATTKTGHIPVLGNFQSTLLQEERQFRCNSLASVLTFNPRSYKRSDGKPGQNQQRKCSFQSTLLQEERRHFYGMSAQNKLSIHAPTRGATPGWLRAGRKLGLSIHAPTRGATWDKYRGCKLEHLSIHAPTRGATFPWCREKGVLNLSIHAPTRGATFFQLWHHPSCAAFNPRSYKRSDSEDQKRMITIYTFNPRSYKRSDKGQTSMFALIFFFQSTLLQEERRFKLWCIFTVIFFQSTLLQEERH